MARSRLARLSPIGETQGVRRVDGGVTPQPTDLSLLRPGETCARTARAGRLAILVDNEAYFRAARAALETATRSVLLLGWTFDPRTRLDPAADGETIGDLLNRLVRERPGIDIRLLIWDSALPVAAVRGLFPQRARFWLDAGIRLHLDASHPLGACHHQKLLVVDDALAFCAGGDFSPERWDRPAHRDRDPLRRMASGRMHAPRHGMATLVDGEAAQALGGLARERWRRATGETVLAPAPAGADRWPGFVEPLLRDADAGIVLTRPGWNGAEPVRHGERLFLEMIAAARETIYLENQYFAAPAICDALAARLAEPDGPEILAVLTPHSPSYFDRWIMDAARDATIARLAQADRHGRFRAFAPHAPAGRPVIVHSKLMTIDDRFVRIGSANLNNRSMGLDTECDLAFAVPAESGRRLRNGLIGHFLGREAEAVEAESRRRGGMLGAIEALNREGRLRRLAPEGAGPVGALTAWPHLGDPEGPGDAWRPWRRRLGPAQPPWAAAAAVAGAALGAWAAGRIRRRKK